MPPDEIVVRVSHGYNKTIKKAGRFKLLLLGIKKKHKNR